MGLQRLSEEANDLLASLRIMLATHARKVTEISRKNFTTVFHNICILIALLKHKQRQYIVSKQVRMTKRYVPHFYSESVLSYTGDTAAASPMPQIPGVVVELTS